MIFKYILSQIRERAPLLIIGVSEELRHIDYWGQRQQLLAGKVIADFVDPDYGPMDPVFGVLLSPVAGKLDFLSIFHAPNEEKK